jgi:hypothetical protein
VELVPDWPVPPASDALRRGNVALAVTVAVAIAAIALLASLALPAPSRTRPAEPVRAAYLSVE